ncbi:MAG: alpha-amylase family protein [Mangrovibacterium sp.]
MKLTGTIISISLFLIFSHAVAQDRISSPSWAKDLIIYEIATKSFTSPKGPESGTFNSTREKIPYLKELGITGIWLTGTNLADRKHFYNIWTQYACIRQDSIDPSLGTPEEFRALVDEAHKNGIKVFLDVITHGVVDGSSLIDEKPHWFRGSSWGMTDFDWYGGHTDLDDWWVKTFTDYVVKFGVDGYRLDVGIYRPDLWHKIKENSLKSGHPIVVFGEVWEDGQGTCDFYQRLTRLSIQRCCPDYNGILLHHNVNRFYNEFIKRNFFNIDSLVINYEDGSLDYGVRSKNNGNLKLTLTDLPEIRPSDDNFVDNQLKVKLKVENINPEKVIKEIWTVPYAYHYYPHSYQNATYHYGQFAGQFGWYKMGITNTPTLELSITPFIPNIVFFSTQLSCHDDGWDSFPLSSNPYVAEGSRSMFGYSCLFTPSIPIFMSGEEFNADFVALPKMTPDVWGKGEPGKGKWLYGSMIQWNQLDLKDKREMLDDVKKMISIRKQNSDIFFACRTDKKPPVKEITFNAEVDNLQVPFLIFNSNKAILIAGNNTERNVDIRLKISLEDTPLQNYNLYRITDLWNDKRPKINNC